MQNYISDIQALEKPSFKEIQKIAKDNCGKECPGIYNCKPWLSLGHGVDLLDSHGKLCKYLCSYGDMHETKMRDAVKYLPKSLLEGEFEVIDWGCGQGIGTICLFDHINDLELTNKVKRVTLIEPSPFALKRAKFHVESYNINSFKVNTYSEYFQNIRKEEIESKFNLPVIHIFSNILDVKEIDLKDLALKIDETVCNDNYIVSVGPINQTNRRIDHFHKYFNVPCIYDYENRQYNYVGNKPYSYKAKVYKLEYNEQGNLIPIEFYPSVQFHSSYQLDCVTGSLKKEAHPIIKSLSVFETSTPFDIGASVYDDIHPILAVLNNIVTRGLPTKASPFIEEEFLKAFNYSKEFEEYETLSFPRGKELEVEKIIPWYNAVVNEGKD